MTIRERFQNSLLSGLVLALMVINVYRAVEVNAEPEAGTAKPKTAFDKYVRSARKASEEGKDAESYSNWQGAVREAEKLGGKDGRLPFALVHLGDMELTMRQSHGAIAALKRAAQLREQMGRAETLGMARNLERLGAAYITLPDYADAEQVLKRALKIEEKCHADNEQVALTLKPLCQICHTDKHLKEAEQYCRRLLDLAVKSPNSPTSAMYKDTANSELMTIYSDTDRKEQFEDKFHEMLWHRRKAPSPERAQAIQKVYARLDRAIDAGEESSFMK